MFEEVMFSLCPRACMFSIGRLLSLLLCRGYGSKGKSPSSSRWLQRQNKDPLVSRALVDNYRCRSAYKLLELDKKYHLLKQGGIVVDCGSSPGSWAQVAAQRVRANQATDTGHSHMKLKYGTVFAIDIQAIASLPGVHILERSDLRDPAVHKKILELLGNSKVDTVLSDMAPNSSGIRTLDHQRIIDLGYAAYELAKKCLKDDSGSMVCKLWQGSLVNTFKQELKGSFEIVDECRLKATRTESSEVYIVARGFRSPFLEP